MPNPALASLNGYLNGIVTKVSICTRIVVPPHVREELGAVRLLFMLLIAILLHCCVDDFRCDCARYEWFACMLSFGQSMSAQLRNNKYIDDILLGLVSC
jgi:hypothetical protein